MRLLSLIGLASVVSVWAQSENNSTDSTTPGEVEVSAAWPDTNPFGHVVNGEKNVLTVTIENKSPQNISLLNIAGSFHHPESGALIKNLTAQKIPTSLPVLNGVKIPIPYTFYSEFKPGDFRLNIWLEHSTTGKDKIRIQAFDSIVTIVEPEGTIWDFKLISTYIMVALILGGAGYLTFSSLAPQSKKPRVKKAPVSAPAAEPSTPGAGVYQEEWIPEHHLKKSTKKKGYATSGDELSGAESSGTELKRRKSKK